MAVSAAWRGERSVFKVWMVLGLAAATTALAAVAGSTRGIASALAALLSNWSPPMAQPAALPPALAATPLFAQFALTVVAGIMARKAAGSVAGGAAFGEHVRRALNRLVLWLTLPALVFDTVHRTPPGIDLVQAPAAAIGGMAGTALLAWLVLVRLYGRTPVTGGLVLAASAGSVSFLGIPVVRALFGADEARVAVYFAVLNVPLAILSAAIISGRIGGTPTPPAGAGPAGFLLEAARQFCSLPATWALAAGVALHGVVLPDGLQLAVHTLGSSVGPTVMFALGMGLRFERSLAPYRMALPAAVIKLAVSPLVVCACARVVGLSGSGLAAVALQGAMPTQVLSVVIAERYRLDSRVVGLALAMDTALAFVLLPLLVAAAQALGIG